jgi:hypothetical protein
LHARELRIGELVLHAGDQIAIDGTAGAVTLDDVALVTPAVEPRFEASCNGGTGCARWASARAWRRRRPQSPRAEAAGFYPEICARFGMRREGRTTEMGTCQSTTDCTSGGRFGGPSSGRSRPRAS